MFELGRDRGNRGEANLTAKGRSKQFGVPATQLRGVIGHGACCTGTHAEGRSEAVAGEFPRSERVRHVARRADLGQIEQRRNAHEGLLDHSFGEHRPCSEQPLARHARHRVGGYLEVLFHELILVHLFEHI